MIEPAQIRAARALLDMSQIELARHAKIGVATVRRIEGSTDELRVMVDTLQRIQRALEAAGIVFIDQDDEIRARCALEEAAAATLIERASRG